LAFLLKVGFFVFSAASVLVDRFAGGCSIAHGDRKRTARVGADPACGDFAHMAFGMPETGVSAQVILSKP
jgi:hypothetical protein